MDIIIISVIAFFTAILTFFSGFGLGTILTPVFMLFFPIEVAIALTGIVHFSNNIFKFFIIKKDFNREVLIRFGIPAILFSFIGALILLKIPKQEPIFSYQLFEHQCNIYFIKLIIAFLMIFFALVDLIPFFKRLEFSKKKLPIGGALSGFFGGLTGSQGALRTAFLIRSGLSKESFIATTVIISSFVDITRLGVYSSRIINSNLTNHIGLIFFATFSAMAGAFLGNKLLKKVTLNFLQISVAIMLLIFAICLALGII